MYMYIDTYVYVYRYICIYLYTYLLYTCYINSSLPDGGWRHSWRFHSGVASVFVKSAVAWHNWAAPSGHVDLILWKLLVASIALVV